MRWDVAFRPADPLPEAPVALVVDVLRATTSMVTMLANGARAVAIERSPERALEYGRRRGFLVAGEQGGLPPAGFDFGNSPSAFTADAVAGRSLVLSTTNGTLAIRAAARRKRVIIGALANLTAAASAALALREDVVVVCAGHRGGRFVGLDDVYVAGRLALLAEEGGARLLDGARIAAACARAYPTPLAAFLASEHGRHLVTLGLAADLDWCAQTDWTPIVPVAVGRRPPLLVTQRDSRLP
ncbi:MAG: 2-phosphosulfolactate phosphatase [Chloroflexota bacterium]|nr:2-phosphosulfolactate phosphatase [Dehalococcoidia bacterium]MDW8252890.1 2-phosphosulfolactate phosphatase [Chloroflexota bacterium]